MGFVMDVKLAADAESNETLGFALVMMTIDESARGAMKALNRASLHGVVIQVEVAPEGIEGAPMESRARP